jgi:hypothetical protein
MLEHLRALTEVERIIDGDQGAKKGIVMHTSRQQGTYAATVRRHTNIAVLILGLLLPGSAFAEGEPASGEIVADRPGLAESAEVVGPWMLQFEGGFTLARDSAGGTSSRSMGGPSPLLRLGLSRRLELRFETDGFLRESSLDSAPTQRVSGLADLGVGAKLKLVDEGKVRPMFSIIPSLSLPTGNRQMTSNGYDPAINFVWSKNLSRGFDSGGSVKFSSVTSDERRLLQRALSVSFGHKLLARTAGFWEVYQLSPPERDRSSLWIFDTGLTHALGRNAQIDLSVGRSLRPTTPTWFLSTGIAFRVPLRSTQRHASDTRP